MLQYKKKDAHVSEMKQKKYIVYLSRCSLSF